VSSIEQAVYMRAVVILRAVTRTCPCKPGWVHIWPAKGSEIALARRVAGRDCSRPAPSERHVQVSLHAAQALRTPLAERGHATSNTYCDTTFTIRAWSPRTVIRRESAPVSVATAVICLLSSGSWPNSLVMQDQMDVSPLSRGVILPVGTTPIHPITGWPSLFPSSSSRTSVGSPCGSLSLTGDVRGCHVPSQSQRMG
jgi:hypothetical protein